MVNQQWFSKRGNVLVWLEKVPCHTVILAVDTKNIREFTGKQVFTGKHWHSETNKQIYENVYCILQNDSEDNLFLVHCGIISYKLYQKSTDSFRIYVVHDLPVHWHTIKQRHGSNTKLWNLGILESNVSCLWNVFGFENKTVMKWWIKLSSCCFCGIPWLM